MSRVEIRVLGQDQAEVEAWVNRVITMAREATEAQVYQSHIREGRRGDFLAYVNIPSLAVQPVAAVRLPRKARLSAGRRRRASG